MAERKDLRLPGSGRGPEFSPPRAQGCGYYFQAASSSETVSELHLLEGKWGIDRNDFTIIYRNGKELWQKPGYSFDNEHGSFGSISLIWENNGTQLLEVTAPREGFGQVVIGTPLIGGPFAGFRPMEFHNRNKRGVGSCVTLLYRRDAGAPLVWFTSPAPHYVEGNAAKPSIADFIKPNVRAVSYRRW